MFRAASPADLTALCDLERAANLAALAHVFPPERFPFPGSDVLARWALWLDDPEVEVLVQDGARGLVAYVAHDDSWLRHLGVRPDHWGRGIATAAVETALLAMGRRGTTLASLWCLEENHRARRLYEYLGWQPAGDLDTSPWPPHPVMLRYTRLVGQ